MAEKATSEFMTEAEASAVEDPRLQLLFSRLFIDRKVEFFDAEPDEEFINVFEHLERCSLEDRRKALEDFRRDLRLEERFMGEYGRMSEILIQSEDFVDNLSVPFLMFSLSAGEDAYDPTYSFCLDFFEVFNIGINRFLVVLHVRNVRQSHMEMYMRFTREEASKVIRALLRIYEDYMGYTNVEPPRSCVAENEFEEIFADAIGVLNAPQFREAREATEAKFKELNLRN
ncbi:MAG: hypothetical protein WED04_10810 [Promethearchaeati archaeon SRVP18_Atabeyarchaeia-1]